MVEERRHIELRKKRTLISSANEAIMKLHRPIPSFNQSIELIELN